MKKLVTMTTGKINILVIDILLYMRKHLIRKYYFVAI